MATTVLTRSIRCRRKGTVSWRPQPQSHPSSSQPSSSSSSSPHHHYHHRRHQTTTAANPNNPWATNAAPAPPPLPPRVISRRAWEAFQKQHPTRYGKPKSSNTNKSSAADEKPWPVNVQRAGYVAAGVLIPYLGTWLAVSNDAARPAVLAALPPWLEDVLRRHFGTPEWDQIPYVDQFDWESSASSVASGNHGHPDVDIPHAFRGEVPCHVRRQQEEIEQAQQQQSDLTVQVLVYDKSANNKDTQNTLLVSDEIKSLPASTLANPRQLLPKDDNSDGSDNKLVAVQFPTDSNDVSSTDSTSFGDAMDLEEQNTSTTTTNNNALKSRLAIYSLWHYQPVAPTTTNDAKGGGKAKFRQAELQKALLQDEIFQLEQELRAGTRAVDDIVYDLERAKRQLRRLNHWWWPF